MKSLLFIVELGGVPVYDEAYARAGFAVEVVQGMRKAMSHIKRQGAPDVICTELNVDPQFRDRVSNLEPLLALLQASAPATRVIVFLDEAHMPNLLQLQERFEICDALYYPIAMEAVLRSLVHATG